MTARLLVTVLLLLPTPALACASCISSAWGDRTFNWAFLGLILMPFIVGGAIATILALRFAALRRREMNGDPGTLGPLASPHKETT